MSIGHVIVLCFGSLIAGIINSFAGGGALFVYPLLTTFGVGPVMANATTSLVIWPGAISSAVGYRKHIAKLPKYYFLLLIPAFAGGLIGAVILKHTSNNQFASIVPWFFVVALILIAIQPLIHKALYSKKAKVSHNEKISILVIALLIFIVASIYGGYFGAGFGIITLGLLGLTTLTDLKQMNGLKNLAGAVINITAVGYFWVNHLIYWHYAIYFVISCLIGGYLGSRYSAKLPSKVIRVGIIVIGSGVAIYLFTKR